MIAVTKKRIFLYTGMFLLYLVIYSCTPSIKPTPDLASSLVSTRITQTVIKPTISRSGKSICENRREAPLFEEIPPIDPAGKIAFIADGVRLINPNNSAIETLDPLGPGIYSSLAWSPDGTILSVTHDLLGGGFSLEVVDFPNGQICSLIEGRGELSDPAWSPDGQNISVADRESGELLNIEIPEMKVSILAYSVYSSPQWIDNSHVSYPLWNSETKMSSLVSLDIQTQEKVEFLKESKLLAFLFSPKGVDLAYSTWDQFLLNITNIKNGITNTVDAYIPFDWTTDGRTLLAETAGQSLVFITVKGTITILPLRIGGTCTRQAFSSDDSMIVMANVFDGHSKRSIAIVNVTTNKKDVLNIPYCCPENPVWNPKPDNYS